MENVTGHVYNTELGFITKMYERYTYKYCKCEL